MTTAKVTLDDLEGHFSGDVTKTLSYEQLRQLAIEEKFIEQDEYPSIQQLEMLLYDLRK